MKNMIVAAAFVAATFLPVSAPVLADSYQGPQHSYAIAIDKLVGFPTLNNGQTTYSYVDNLGPNDFKFQPGGYIFYKVKVKNTSDVNLDNVVIKDVAPAYVDVFTTQINVGTLQPQEEKEYIIQARVFGEGNLPNQSMTCVTNTAQASNDKASAQDTAQLCIERKISVAAPAAIPSTGPEFGLIIASLSGGLAFVGNKLRKIG